MAQKLLKNVLSCKHWEYPLQTTWTKNIWIDYIMVGKYIAFLKSIILGVKLLKYYNDKKTKFMPNKINKLFDSVHQQPYTESIPQVVNRLHKRTGDETKNLYFTNVLPLFARFFIHTLFNLEYTDSIKKIPSTNVNYKQHSNRILFTSFDRILFGMDESGQIDLELFENNCVGLLKTNLDKTPDKIDRNGRTIDVTSSFDLQVMLFIYISLYNKLHRAFTQHGMQTEKAYVAARISIHKIWRTHIYQYSSSFAGEVYFLLTWLLSINQRLRLQSTTTTQSAFNWRVWEIDLWYRNHSWVPSHYQHNNNPYPLTDLVKSVQPNGTSLSTQLIRPFELTVQNCSKFLIENAQHPCNREMENNTDDALQVVKQVTLARERSENIALAHEIFSELQLKVPPWVTANMEFFEMVTKKAGTISTFSNGDMNYVKGAIGLVFTFAWIPDYLKKYKFHNILEEQWNDKFNHADKKYMQHLITRNDGLHAMLKYLDPSITSTTTNLFILNKSKLRMYISSAVSFILLIGLSPLLFLATRYKSFEPILNAMYNILERV